MIWLFTCLFALASAFAPTATRCPTLCAKAAPTEDAEEAQVETKNAVASQQWAARILETVRVPVEETTPNVTAKTSKRGAAWQAIVGGGGVATAPRPREPLTAAERQKEWAANIIEKAKRTRRADEVVSLTAAKFRGVVGLVAEMASPPAPSAAVEKETSEDVADVADVEPAAVAAVTAVARAVEDADADSDDARLSATVEALFDGRLGPVRLSLRGAGAVFSAAGTFVAVRRGDKQQQQQQVSRGLVVARDVATGAECLIDAADYADLEFSQQNNAEGTLQYGIHLRRRDQAEQPPTLSIQLGQADAMPSRTALARWTELRDQRAKRA